MLDQIVNFVHTLGGQTTIIAVVIETILRVTKSDKPLSIAHAISAVMHKVADIVGGIANLMDKVLPQNLK